MSETVFNLPVAIATNADLSRLLRELQTLEDAALAAKARKSGDQTPQVRISRLLEETAVNNRLNLSEDDHRAVLTSNLETLQKSAPSIHISFATEPPVKFLEQILGWLRQNVHPHLLLQVGLQPSIAAGCILRTQNKVFDMSLRRHLDGQRDYLLQLIKGAVDGH